MDDSWQKVIIAAISPLVAAFVGTLIVGLWASRITERVQQRRQERDLREKIIVEMTETATALYLEPSAIGVQGLVRSPPRIVSQRYG